MKTSREILHELESYKDNELYIIPGTAKEYWTTFPVGKEWYDEDEGWLRKINETEYKKIGKRTIQNGIPLFCPKCKMPLSSDMHVESYKHKGHCLTCELELITK